MERIGRPDNPPDVFEITRACPTNARWPNIGLHCFSLPSGAHRA
jgi:hypothetical protein